MLDERFHGFLILQNLVLFQILESRPKRGSSARYRVIREAITVVGVSHVEDNGINDFTVREVKAKLRAFAILLEPH
jgi:hypothetical protein